MRIVTMAVVAALAFALLTIQSGMFTASNGEPVKLICFDDDESSNVFGEPLTCWSTN